MKILTLLFTKALLCISVISFSQEIIDFDFATHKLTKPDNIKEGASILILYKNINKYAVKSSASITSGNRSYDDGLDQLQTILGELAKEKKTTEDKDKELSAIVSPAVPNSKGIKQKLDAVRKYLTDKAQILTDIEMEFSNILQEVWLINFIMAMDKDITAATNDKDLRDSALMDKAIFIQAGTTGVSRPEDFTVQLASGVGEISSSLVEIVRLISDLENNFLNTAALTDAQRKEEGAKLEAIKAEIKKRSNIIESTYSGENLKTLQGNAADMGRRALKLLNQNFTIDPIVIGNADGDYIEISDKLTDNAGNQVFEIKPFKINTYGGRRVDFSVGLSINIGGHGKYSYDLRKNPTNATSGTAVDSVILLSDDEDRLFKFSPAFFVHWYKISKKNNIQWMLTTGLTPDFTDLSDSRLSMGSSLGFSSSNSIARRLVLSAGISFGYADVLKTKYKNLDDFRSFGDIETDDLTKKALKIGAFFSVSYNLGGAGH